MKRILVKRGLALVLSFAMVSSMLFAFGSVEAKKKAYVKSLKVSKSSVSLDVGKSITIKATVKTKGSAKKTVSAKSGSPSVAVKAGKAKKGVTTITLTGKSAGSAFVTVKTKGKNKKGKVLSKKVTVTVKAAGSSADNSNSGSSNTGTISNDVIPIGNNWWKTQPTSVPVGVQTPAPTEEPVDFDFSKDVDVQYGTVNRLVKFKINKETTTEEELEAEGYTVENGEASKETLCETATYTFQSLPNTLTEIKQIPLDKEFGPMAAIICALATAPIDKYNMQNISGCPTYDILDYLNGASRGPDAVNDSTKSLDQQFLASNTFPNLRGGYQLCFFDGAEPTNEYTPNKPLTFTLYVGPYYIPSKTMLSGKLRPETHMVFLKFGGDDSDRYIDVFKSSKDNNWYCYENQWQHMGAGYKPIQQVL